ncbi:MAG: lytic transglycosylase domain-containing protein [Candidatus Binatia bacterium]
MNGRTTKGALQYRCSRLLARGLSGTEQRRRAGMFGSRSVFLATLLAACLLPVPIGLASPPLQAQAPNPPNQVGTLFDALSRCRASLPESQRWRIAGVIHHESQRYGYDPLFILAMVEVESACLPTARGRRGAVGLIQVKPSTARAVAEEAGVAWQGVETLAHPISNVQLGLWYLHQLEKRFADPYIAVAAYNLGPTKVARMPRQQARRTRYVHKILARYDDLLAQRGIGRS